MFVYHTYFLIQNTQIKRCKTFVQRLMWITFSFFSKILFCFIFWFTVTKKQILCGSMKTSRSFHLSFFLKWNMIVRLRIIRMIAFKLIYTYKQVYYKFWSNKHTSANSTSGKDTTKTECKSSSERAGVLAWSQIK